MASEFANSALSSTQWLEEAALSRVIGFDRSPLGYESSISHLDLYL